jgi:hypothetical protein
MNSIADIDEDYEGDLGPLLADLDALRSALGDSYQAYAEAINPDNDDDDDNLQQQQQEQAEEGTTARPTTAPRRSKPAPLIERLAAVSSALEANISLQERLGRLVTSVTRAQDQAIGIRDRVRASQRRRQHAASAPHALSARRNGQDQQFTGVSWFWSQPGAPAPPGYPGYTEIKTVFEMLPLVFPRRKWQEEELHALCDGVVQLVQERLLNNLLTDLETAPLTAPTTAADNPGDGTAGGVANAGGGVFQNGISLEEFEARQAPIRSLTASSPSVVQIAETFSEAEWATVAHRSAPGRTAQECTLAWKNAAMPTINHAKFTVEEDTRLMNLVEQYGTRSWARIAAELHQHTSPLVSPLVSSGPQAPLPSPPAPSAGPTTLTSTTAPPIPTNNNNNATTNPSTTAAKQRTPLACMSRYQQLLHANRSTQEFTTVDCERLVQIVNRVGVQWKRVAEEFGGPWDYEQLMHYWRRYAQRREGGDGVTSPAVPRRGKWLPEEDESLLTAVALYGKKWSLVATLVPGRSDVQCRERYANCLDPEVNKDPWNEQEDEILKANAQNFINTASGKIKWSALAGLVPGRTDYAVKKRWLFLSTGQAGGGARAQGGGGARANGGTSGGNGASGSGGAGPSRAPKSVPKKKEPVIRKKKQKMETEATTAPAPAAPAPAAPPVAPPRPRPRPRAPPPPPPPPEEPVISRRGRAITKPTRLKD